MTIQITIGRGQSKKTFSVAESSLVKGVDHEAFLEKLAVFISNHEDRYPGNNYHIETLRVVKDRDPHIGSIIHFKLRSRESYENIKTGSTMVKNVQATDISQVDITRKILSDDVLVQDRIAHHKVDQNRFELEKREKERVEQARAKARADWAVSKAEKSKMLEGMLKKKIDHRREEDLLHEAYKLTPEMFRKKVRLGTDEEAKLDSNVIALPQDLPLEMKQAVERIVIEFNRVISGIQQSEDWLHGALPASFNRRALADVVKVEKLKKKFMAEVHAMGPALNAALKLHREHDLLNFETRHQDNMEALDILEAYHEWTGSVGGSDTPPPGKFKEFDPGAHKIVYNRLRERFAMSGEEARGNEFAAYFNEHYIGMRKAYEEARFQNELSAYNKKQTQSLVNNFVENNPNIKVVDQVLEDLRSYDVSLMKKQKAAEFFRQQVRDFEGQFNRWLEGVVADEQAIKAKVKADELLIQKLKADHTYPVYQAIVSGRTLAEEGLLEKFSKAMQHAYKSLQTDEDTWIQDVFADPAVKKVFDEVSAYQANLQKIQNSAEQNERLSKVIKKLVDQKLVTDLNEIKEKEDMIAAVPLNILFERKWPEKYKVIENLKVQIAAKEAKNQAQKWREAYEKALIAAAFKVDANADNWVKEVSEDPNVKKVTDEISDYYASLNPANKEDPKITLDDELVKILPAAKKLQEMMVYYRQIEEDRNDAQMCLDKIRAAKMRLEDQINKFKAISKSPRYANLQKIAQNAQNWVIRYEHQAIEQMNSIENTLANFHTLDVYKLDGVMGPKYKADQVRNTILPALLKAEIDVKSLAMLSNTMEKDALLTGVQRSKASDELNIYEVTVRVLSNIPYWSQQTRGIFAGINVDYYDPQKKKVVKKSVPDGIGLSIQKVIDNPHMDIAKKNMEIRKIFRQRREENKGLFTDKPLMRKDALEDIYKLYASFDPREVSDFIQKVENFEKTHMLPAKPAKAVKPVIEVVVKESGFKQAYNKFFGGKAHRMKEEPLAHPLAKRQIKHNRGGTEQT